VFFLLSLSFPGTVKLIYMRSFRWEEYRLMIIVSQVNDEVKDEIGNIVKVVKVVSPENGIHVCLFFPRLNMDRPNDSIVKAMGSCHCPSIQPPLEPSVGDQESHLENLSS